jgi:hypothetical protein
VKIELANATAQQLEGTHTIHLTRQNDEKGNAILEAVSFYDGKADCDENTAQWLVDQKLAAKAGDAKTAKPDAPADDAAAKK